MVTLDRKTIKRINGLIFSANSNESYTEKITADRDYIYFKGAKLRRLLPGFIDTDQIVLTLQHYGVANIKY